MAKPINFFTEIYFSTNNIDMFRCVQIKHFQSSSLPIYWQVSDQHPLEIIKQIPLNSTLATIRLTGVVIGDGVEIKLSVMISRFSSIKGLLTEFLVIRRLGIENIDVLFGAYLISNQITKQTKKSPTALSPTSCQEISILLLLTDLIIYQVHLIVVSRISNRSLIRINNQIVIFTPIILSILYYDIC